MIAQEKKRVISGGRAIKSSCSRRAMMMVELHEMRWEGENQSPDDDGNFPSLFFLLPVSLHLFHAITQFNWQLIYLGLIRVNHAESLVAAVCREANSEQMVISSPYPGDLFFCVYVWCHRHLSMKRVGERWKRDCNLMLIGISGRQLSVTVPSHRRLGAHDTATSRHFPPDSRLSSCWASWSASCWRRWKYRWRVDRAIFHRRRCDCCCRECLRGRSSDLEWVWKKKKLLAIDGKHFVSEKFYVFFFLPLPPSAAGNLSTFVLIHPRYFPSSHTRPLLTLK